MKTKIIEIKIEHNLTPFHEKILQDTLNGIVQGLHIFWTNKSKKKFIITKD